MVARRGIEIGHRTREFRVRGRALSCLLRGSKFLLRVVPGLFPPGIVTCIVGGTGALAIAVPIAAAAAAATASPPLVTALLRSLMRLRCKAAGCVDGSVILARVMSFGAVVIARGGDRDLLDMRLRLVRVFVTLILAALILVALMLAALMILAVLVLAVHRLTAATTAATAAPPPRSTFAAFG